MPVRPKFSEPVEFSHLEPIQDTVDHLGRLVEHMRDTRLGQRDLENLQLVAEHTTAGAVPGGLVAIALLIRGRAGGRVGEAAQGLLEGWQQRGALKTTVPMEEMKGALTFRREGEAMVLSPSTTAWSWEVAQQKSEELSQLPQAELDRELDTLAYGAFSGIECSAVRLALHKAGENLAFRRRLEPHRQNLLEAKEVARRESTYQFAHTSYVSGLTRAFPDLLEPEFVNGEVVALQNVQDSYKVPELLEGWWEENPKLVGPSLEQVAELQTPIDSDKYAELFRKALTDYDYKPSSKTLGWMVGNTVKTLSRSGCPTELMNCLSEVRDRFPEMYESIGIGPTRKSLEDLAFEQLTDQRGILANSDDKFRSLISPHSDKVKSFARFVQLETRKEQLLKTARHRLSQTSDFYEAGYDTLQAVGLLARLAPQDPQLQRDLIGVLGVADLSRHRHVQEFTLKLFQGQVLEEQLQNFEVTRDTLGSKTAFLMKAAKGVDKPHLQKRLQDLWQEAMEGFGMSPAPYADQGVQQTLDHFVQVDSLTSSVPLERRWERFQQHLGLVQGDDQAALKLLDYDGRLEAAHRQEHPQMWARFTELQRRSQGDFEQNRELFEHYRTHLALGQLSAADRWSRMQEALTMAGEDPVKAERISEVELDLRRSGQFEKKWPDFQRLLKIHGLEGALEGLELQSQLDGAPDLAIDIQMDADTVWIGDQAIEVN